MLSLNLNFRKIMANYFKNCKIKIKICYLKQLSVKKVMTTEAFFQVCVRKRFFVLKPETRIL